MTKTIDRRITLPPLPKIDDVTRREFLIGAAGLLLLPAGCGDEKGGSDGRSSGETRTIDHALGETKIPIEPRRVVVVDQGVTLEHLVALGVVPVGAPLDAEIPEYIAGRLEETESIGVPGEPNLEKISVLESDLIVGWSPFFVEPVYDELSEIAPTVATPREAFSEWRQDLLFVADVVGRARKGEELLEDYDQRVGEAREAIGAERLGDLEVSVFRAVGGSGTLSLMMRNSFCGSVMADVGVRRPPSQQDTAEFGEKEISLERLTEADGDVIFIPTFADDEEANEALARTREHPLWQKLRAVQAGQVYEVPIDPWL